MLNILALFLILQISAQTSPVKVVVEDKPNKLAFFAIIGSTTGYDIMVTISGINFRQSKAKPHIKNW